MLAASRIGAAYVNINPLFKPPQVAYLAQDCDMRVMIVDSGRLADLEPGTVSGLPSTKARGPTETPPARLRGPRGGALGRRGRPRSDRRGLGGGPRRRSSTRRARRGCRRAWRPASATSWWGPRSSPTYLENTAEDRILSALPLNFDAGMSQFTTSLRVGATLYLLRSRLPGDLDQEPQAARDHGRYRRPAPVVAAAQGREVHRGEPAHAPALPGQHRRAHPAGQPGRAEAAHGASRAPTSS